MINEEDERATSATISNGRNFGYAPNQAELAIYIAELTTELARVAENSRLPIEVTYLLRVTAASAAKLASQSITPKKYAL